MTSTDLKTLAGEVAALGVYVRLGEGIGPALGGVPYRGAWLILLSDDPDALRAGCKVVAGHGADHVAEGTDHDLPIRGYFWRCL